MHLLLLHSLLLLLQLLLLLLLQSLLLLQANNFLTVFHCTLCFRLFLPYFCHFNDRWQRSTLQVALSLSLCFGPLGWPDCLTAQPTDQTHLPPHFPIPFLAGLIAVMCYMRAWMKCRSNERDRKKKHTKKQLQRRCSEASTSEPAALAVKNECISSEKMQLHIRNAVRVCV